MNLILFLGSGASRPSGLPLVGGIGDLIFRGSYHRDESGDFREGSPRRRSSHHNGVPQIRRLLRLLARYDTFDRTQVIGSYPKGKGFASSGAIYRTATTYEDLYALCWEMHQWMQGLSDNALTTPFLQLITKAAGTLAGTGSLRKRMLAIGHLAHDASFYILWVVARALHASRIIGLDLILELAKSAAVARLTIVTLNHDDLIEQLLHRDQIDVIDGFGERDGDVRWYDDALYDDAEAKIRLIKLHGSISWYRFVRSGAAWPAVLCSGSVAGAVDGMSKSLKTLSQLPFFLCGGRKEAWYQHALYADLHHRFHEELRRCDRMVMSGYGWADTGITNQLERWLDQRASNRLVLLDEKPEDVVVRSPLMAMSYDSFVAKGQLIPIRTWLCKTSLPDIEAALAS